MDVNKYELVTEISMLCDELETCKRKIEVQECEIETKRREIEELQRGVTLCESESDEGLSSTDAYCLRVGRKEVFSRSFYSWRNVYASRDEETGEVKINTSFEKFRESAFASCPDHLSKCELLSYFDTQLHALYDEQKKKAIEELEQEEAEDE